MMCQRIGRPPIATIGFGRRCVSSLIRVPRPPANMTHFMDLGAALKRNGCVRSKNCVHVDTREDLKSAADRGIQNPKSPLTADRKGMAITALHALDVGIVPTKP